MAALLIKSFPTDLHRRLKQLAVAHHRSMTQEVLVLLEESLERPSVVGEFGPTFRGAFRLTQAFLNRAKRRGRFQSAGRS